MPLKLTSLGSELQTERWNRWGYTLTLGVAIFWPLIDTKRHDTYLDPSSYADVVFSPFDGEVICEINGVESLSQISDHSSSYSLSRSPSSSSSDYIKLTVSNPNKEQGVPKWYFHFVYWTYIIALQLFSVKNNLSTTRRLHLYPSVNRRTSGVTFAPA